MDKQTMLTQGEWQLMQLIWQRPHSLMELVDELGKTVGWSKSTVATMVRRMEEKGILRYEEQGRTKIFYPAVSREDAAARETDSLMNRAFPGSNGLLVSNMARRNTLSTEDIDGLCEILRQAKSNTQ